MGMNVIASPGRSNPVGQTTRLLRGVHIERSECARNDISASVLLSGKGHPAWNMAVDEALLRIAQQEAQRGLILRFYDWDRPSVSIGYFQKFTLADSHATVVRRPTGGGFVDHRTDITYSLIFPQDLFGTGPAYAFVHDLVRGVLAQWPAWQETFLVPSEKATRGKIARCFQQPSAGDVMLQDRKLAGAAQRRCKGWILHQGSIDVGPADVACRMDVARGLIDRLERHLGTHALARELTAREATAARQLLESRYASDDWNKKF